MAVKVWGEIWVCVDCMLIHANGECDTDRPESEPEPWSTVDQSRFDVAMGGEHREVCDAGDSDDCDCATNTFSTAQCEGCGSYLHGERHLFTLFVREA